MKIKYYVENDKGERILARTSNNEYNFALVDKERINNGIKYIYCCSGTYNNIVKQYDYYKNNYTRNYKYYVEHDNMELAELYKKDLGNLEIVKLIRG
jgi:non-homologous end joining protein Ku